MMAYNEIILFMLNIKCKYGILEMYSNRRQITGGCFRREFRIVVILLLVIALEKNLMIHDVLFPS